MIKRFVFAVATLIFVVTGGHALEADKIAAIKRAAEEFTALAKESEKTGQPPRSTDPKIEALLKPILDTAEIERENAVPFTQIPLITEWNTAILSVFRVYLLAGTEAMTDQARAERSNQNLVTFMPEGGRVIDAMLWAQSAIIDTAQNFLATATPQQLENPNVKAGFGQIRTGAAQTLRGMLEVMALDGLTPAWREARLRAILALVPRTAKTVLPEEKKILHQVATAVANRMPEGAVKTGLQKVVTTLQ